MHGGADAADALGEKPGVARVAAFQDELDAAPHLPRRPGVGDLAVLHLDIDAEVALDAGDGIDGDARHGLLLAARRMGNCLTMKTKAASSSETKPMLTIISGMLGK